MELQFTPIPLQFGCHSICKASRLRHKVGLPDILDASRHSKRVIYQGQNLTSPDQAFGENDAMSGAREASLKLGSGHSNTSSGYSKRLQANSIWHDYGHLLVKEISKPLIDNLKLLSDSPHQELMSVADAPTIGLYQQ